MGADTPRGDSETPVETCPKCGNTGGWMTKDDDTQEVFFDEGVCDCPAGLAAREGRRVVQP